MDKAQQILALIDPFVREGRILPRTYAEINDNIDDFVLLFEKEKLIACAGLKDCKDNGVGEIYSLAVSKNAQKTGTSSRLLTQIISKAKALNFAKVFALSKHNQQWFIKHGFTQMNISELPKNRQALFDHHRSSSIFFKDVN